MGHYGRMSKIEFPKFTELAAMHVYDKALAWHQQMIKRYGEACSWELYEQEALRRFGTVFEDPMDEISMPIRMFRLTTLADAFAMARMQEATNAAMKP
ncbi:hypothetical protein Tco_1191085, partial [Tanacetum coccineum]